MIPLATTTVSVLRLAEADEPFEEPGEVSVIAAGVRAVIASPSGREVAVGGSQEVVQFRLSCDPIEELTHLDTVQDDTTGEVYEVVWARQRVGLGLEHTQAGLKQVSGASSTP